MKRKGHHDIPDFSHKRPGNSVRQDEERRSAPPPRAPVRAKPQATNAKSGRRGQ